MALLDHIESILRAGGSLHQLSAMAIEHLSKGMTRQELLDALEGIRAALRSRDREADEDTVLELMDVFANYCSPQMKIEL